MATTFSETEQVTISPRDLQPISGTERVYPSIADIDATVAKAIDAQKLWRAVPISERIAKGYKFIDVLDERKDVLAKELTLQMGRPVSQTPGEIKGTIDRAKHLLSIAPSSLADVPLKESDKPGFRRYIKKEPIGVILIIIPWNYPYLCAINSVLPALLAGNAVILKPSPQVPLVAERFAELFKAAGLPDGLLTPIHLSNKLTQYLATHKSIQHISFTGSVEGGRAIYKAAAGYEGVGFKGVGLELGGKDPAYVRADADVKYAVAEVVDGAMFNSGQSCCAVERVYVHSSVYDAFLEGAAELVKTYKLGDPSSPDTNLGPVVSLAAADRIRRQIFEAEVAGARKLVDEKIFTAAHVGTAYVAPQVLADVDHTMPVMMEETFGPVMGVMKVNSDEEAIKLMNDSKYGLTASIWSRSDPANSPELQHIIDSLQCGTVFLNRCDNLDPALPWGGVKDSGRGVSLSTFGFDQLVRLKSVHLKFPQ